MGLCYSKPPRRGRRTPSHHRHGSGVQVRERTRSSIYATPMGTSYYYTTLPSQDSIDGAETYSSNLYRPTIYHRESQSILKEPFETETDAMLVGDLRSSRMTTNATSSIPRMRVAEHRRPAPRSSRRNSTRRSHRSSRYRTTSSRTYGNSRSNPTTNYSGRTLIEDDPRSDYWDWALASHRFPLDQDEYRSLTGRSYGSSARTSKVSHILRPSEALPMCARNRPSILTFSKATMSSYSNYHGFAAPAPPRRYRVVVR